jgi:hypothetical protein
MLVDIRLNPQAQKERAIKEVFEKMSLDRKWQEDVMNDFFRSEPTALGDIGYWNNKFYIKDVSLAEFLAEEIANRVRMEFREDKKLADFFNVKSAKGTYGRSGAVGYFRLEIMAEPKWFKQFEKEEVSDGVFSRTVKIAADVLHGYNFNDFDYIKITSQFDGKSLKVLKDDLENFRRKKIKLEDVLVNAQ